MAPRSGDLQSSASGRPRNLWPFLRTTIVVVLVAASVAAAAVGWYYSNQILGPDRMPEKTGQVILGRTDSTLTLAPTTEARRPGRWAIEWPGGYGSLGPLITIQADRVTTHFERVSGSPPETTAYVAGFARDADPLTWFGTAFEEIVVASSIGPLAGWLIPGMDSTWALFVHGRGVTRAEVLRMLPAFRTLGLPCLVITYRNDPGAPRADGGTYRMGATEWRDLEDAVRAARLRGARDVVLVGCSMGGGIVAEFLRRSSLRRFVRAAVLDAPSLDWNAVLATAARERGVPAFVTEIGKIVTSLRTGLDWNDLTERRHATAFATPILIIHGDADHTVPLEVSEAFTAARPDLVTLVRVPNADHVESANVDRDGYAKAVTGWLSARGVGAARP